MEKKGMQAVRLLSVIIFASLLIAVEGTSLEGQGTSQTPDPQQTVGQESSKIVAAIDEQLLNAIDELAGSTDSNGNYLYYNKDWKLNLDQYKAWIATIAWSEGHLGGYSAHSQCHGCLKRKDGSLVVDMFYHQDAAAGSNFCFSDGIGPFQVDNGHYLGDDNCPWDQWATIDKLDYRKALVSVLKHHYNQFKTNPKSITLNDFTLNSKWRGTGRAETCWVEVTGTVWQKKGGGGYSQGKQPLNWPEIREKLAKNAKDRGDMSYDSQISNKGLIQWSITINDKDVLTDNGKQVIFDGQYPTWLITARDHWGNNLYKYYYTYRPADKLEVWAWPANCDKKFQYIFVRDYSKKQLQDKLDKLWPQAQFPEGRSKNGLYAGFTLSHPALSLDFDPPNKPSVPLGTTLGLPKTSYKYSTSATDPSGAQIKYTFYWGEGTPQPLTGWYKFGAPARASHFWTKAGTYHVKTKAANCYDSEWSDPLTVVINTPPQIPSKPKAIESSTHYAWVPYSYTTSAKDPDGDQLQYIFDWDDEKPLIPVPTDPVDSEKTVSSTHFWTKAGIYHVQVKASDTKQDSRWSRILTVRIAVNNRPNKPTVPSGDIVSGTTRISYSYTTTANDPDKDKVKYTFDWDDGNTDTTNLVASGTAASASHFWTKAGTYHVKAKAIDGKGAPSVWSDPLTVTISASQDVCRQGCKYSTIQAAVDAANPSDVINVAEGTYTENVHIDKSLTMKGAGAGKTIVDGNHTGSVFIIDSDIDVSLSDMTIQNGYARTGGAIYNRGSRLTISNSIITKNRATIIGAGGGIHNNGGTIIMKSCEVSGNRASGMTGDMNMDGIGGGIYNRGTFTIDDCTISKNTAAGASGYGSGIYNSVGTLTMNNCMISGNIASGDIYGDGRGGGIYNSGGTLFIGGTSQIIDNQALAGYGGGIFSGSGSVTLDGTNAAIKSNKAHLPDALPTGAPWYQQYGVYVPSGAIPTTTNGFTPATQVTDNTYI